MKKILFLMDPLDRLNKKKDTTLAMILAGQQSGCTCYYSTPASLRLLNDEVLADVARIEVATPIAFSEVRVSELQSMSLSEMDFVFIRHDPPFDSEYLLVTYLLEKVEKTGVRVINRPSSIRNCNEKLYALDFPQCCPAHCVSRKKSVLLEFLHMHEDIVLKPLYSMGGDSIFRVRLGDPNTQVILDTISLQQQRSVMAQKYLPEITAGDKRILLINGKPVEHVLARIPSGDDFRGNLAVGGVGVVQPLSARDKWICDQVGKDLVDKGIYFAGLDVIGDFLTEINITSPTCVREIDDHTGSNIALHLIQSVVFNQA